MISARSTDSSVSNGFFRSFSPSLHDSLLTSSKAHAGVYLYSHLIIARLIVACSSLIASNNYWPSLVHYRLTIMRLANVLSSKFQHILASNSRSWYVDTNRASEKRKRETLHNGEQNTPLVDICCPFWLDFMSISYFFTAHCMAKEERTHREREY